MIEKIKHFLELIRLPGMFTAHADILAAFLITGAGFKQTGTLILILLSSSCLFSAGMALNDYFDFEIDRRKRPKRPIPSGRVSRISALIIGICLLNTGLVFAFLAGMRPFCISLALTFVILLYDGLLKGCTFFGPMTMASCRYLNFLMGLSILPFRGWACIPFITGIYIFGVTVLSQKEADGGKAISNIGVCAASVGSVPIIYYFLFLKNILPSLSGVFLAILFSVLLSIHILKLLKHHAPSDFQKTMKILLLSIIVLDMIIASGVVPVYVAMIILLLYFPAIFSGRILRIT